MLEPFKNEEFLNFFDGKVQKEAEKALQKVKQSLGCDYPLIIGDKRIYTGEKIISVNPANPKQVIGKSSKGTEEYAEEAIIWAEKAFETWGNVPAKERARYLFKAAAILRKRKLEFSAYLVLEIGKTWPEADADVAEAIDFLEYYGREAIRLLAEPSLLHYQGEENTAKYIPLGIGIIIPPWNFPLAIMVGMVAASIVTGNTVILKPASLTPIIAVKFMEILEEINLPKGVVNFLPGSGREIGDFLVQHPKTRFINFTGSKEVGLRINYLASKVAPGQKWMKRVAAEMGGKDAIIIDKDIDILEATKIVISSAFGFQGQKCSACSRVIVDEEIYHDFINKLKSEVEKIKIGPPERFDTFLGPVADRDAYEKILKYIEIGKKEGRLLTQGSVLEGEGYYVPPTVFVDVDPTAIIAQEEIFGPVLAVIKSSSFEESLNIANDTEYGLTGGVISNNRENLNKARQSFHVGNLYFNRKITGALVGVQPFGGYNMSGTCAKAGGPDYLQLFMQMKVVVEKY